MKREAFGVTWVEISRSALLHNLRSVLEIAQRKDMKIMPVIKSNAYGHGILEVAQMLEESQLVSSLAVVNLEEALLLRNKGISLRIMVLTYADWWTEQGRDMIKKGILENIEFPVYSEQYFTTLEDIAQSLGKRVVVHLKADTGTSRIGFREEDKLLSFARTIFDSDYAELKSFWTHLACAEEVKNSFNDLQVNVFQDFSEKLLQAGITCPEYHASATAGLISRKDNLVNVGRLGIGLYGLWPSVDFRQWAKQNMQEFYLQPVLTWKTRVLQIKEVEENACIGYDCTYTTPTKTRIAVLPIGYWEGYDRLYSNTASVLIHGKRAKVLGRVCMNMCMVDVSDIPDVVAGDEVVLLGRQGKEEILAEELGKISQTINYEVVTRINAVLPRIIVE